MKGALHVPFICLSPLASLPNNTSVALFPSSHARRATSTQSCRRTFKVDHFSRQHGSFGKLAWRIYHTYLPSGSLDFYIYYYHHVRLRCLYLHLLTKLSQFFAPTTWWKYPCEKFSLLVPFIGEQKFRFTLRRKPGCWVLWSFAKSGCRNLVFALCFCSHTPR